MDFKFIDTSFNFDINGRFFTIDVGELKMVEAVQALLDAAAGQDAGGDVCEKIRARLDVVLGEGTGGELMAGKSLTNDLHHRNLALAIGSAFMKKRVEIMSKAFGAVNEATSEDLPKNEDGQTLQ